MKNQPIQKQKKNSQHKAEMRQIHEQTKLNHHSETYSEQKADPALMEMKHTAEWKPKQKKMKTDTMEKGRKIHTKHKPQFDF